MGSVCEIDWTAAGSWFQGVAGLLGAAAIVYAAKIGAETFGAWRRQRVTERQMAVAERILTLVYRAKDAFHSVRSPGIYSGELTHAEAGLGDKPTHVSDAERKLQVRAQVTLTRLAAQADVWRELWDCLPVARAIFGQPVEMLLRRVWQQHSNIIAALHGYAESEDDAKFRQECQATLAEYSGKNRVDVVAASMVAIVEEAERVLLPVLSASSRD